MKQGLVVFFLLLLCSGSIAVSDPWVRPDGNPNARPIWGVRDGLQIGLWPTPGPRGLLRIYTPYLNQPAGRIMQFIAVEPVVNGTRDLSEMQTSFSDHRQGKPMWTADAVDLAHPPEPSAGLARGIVAQQGSAQTLSFYILVERFDNGAVPVIKVTFNSERPHEVQLQTFAADGSKPMQSCVLTATMGNYARLRHLRLKDRQLEAADLFANQNRGYWDFYPQHKFTDLALENGFALFSASGDADAPHPDDLGPWTYVGNQGRQYWRTAPVANLVGLVNARDTFWASKLSIPGGVAFENFELNSPYQPGQSFYFGIEPVEERK